MSCVNIFKKIRRIWHIHIMWECVCQAKKFARFDECPVYYPIFLGWYTPCKKQYNFLKANQLGSSISDALILTFFLCIWFAHGDKRKKELPFFQFINIKLRFFFGVYARHRPLCFCFCAVFLSMIASSSKKFKNLNTVSGVHFMIKHTKIHPRTPQMPTFDVFI